MGFAVELLSKLLESRQIAVSFPGLALTAQDLLESASYQALCQIRGILQDDALSDPECFQKIEAIVQVFEDLGSGCGSRHDF